MKELQLKNIKIQYARVKPKARQVRVILRVKENIVIASAPLHIGNEVVEEVIRRHEQWLQAQLTLAAERITRPLIYGDVVQIAGEPWRIEPMETQMAESKSNGHRGNIAFLNARQSIAIAPYASTDLHRAVYEAIRLKAQKTLLNVTETLSQRHSLFPNRITVKEQARRWGSCSSKKNINLNWRLIQAPKLVQEYVVIHELAHLRHMHHGPEFWDLVAKMMPDFESSRTWLREHGEDLYRLQRDQMTF